MSGPLNLFGPFTKLARAVREKGWLGTVIQLYTIGDLKFGVLKGTDKVGNKYYEDLSQPFGQHRWVEYADIYTYDPTMIQPEWHGWMHHVFDETPEEYEKLKHNISPTTIASNAIFNHHIGLAYADPIEQVNVSQLRRRGYGIGSLRTGPDEEDKYYKQPGHPLSEVEGGRFEKIKSVEEWDPNEGLAKVDSEVSKK